MKKLLIFLSFNLITLYLHSMNLDSEQNDLTVYAIPGQNGLGSESDYVQKILNITNENIIPVATPSIAADLGQNFCIKHLRNAVTKKGIIHATSQGTATALNYLAEDQGKNIKGLILEAVLASGNRAIEHTATHDLIPKDGLLSYIRTLATLPFSYYWLSYAAKVLFPLYWPAGKQPIKSIEKISTAIPIIIIHSKNDPQLSYDDACALGEC